VLSDGSLHPLYCGAGCVIMEMHDQELLHASPKNVEQLEVAKDLWLGLITQVLCRDFFGEASVHLFVADGTIQRCEARSKRSQR
jgi:hypothetical protein